MSPSSYHRVLGRLLFAMGAGAALGACGAKTTPEPADSLDGDLQTAPGGSGGGNSTPEGEHTPGTNTVSCASGLLQTFCLSPESMREMARRGAGQVALDPPRSDVEVAEAFLDNGCLRHDWVASSCCNAARAPGVPGDGGQCCYQSCEGACCGRALVLGGRALVAEAQQRNDWLVTDATLTGLAHVTRPELTAAERERLVQLWQADALMEHASIASFARFSLQLLALGAPAQLVRAAQAAGLDEVGHAEHAFSITSRLAGRAIGPGALPELNIPLDTDLLSVARATLTEGCIGETLAAIVAQEQAHKAGDSSTRQALHDVAEDETRHAELAFRFVAWALAQGGPELRAALRTEVEQRLARLPEPSPTSDVPAAALHYYGRLTADEQRALYMQARDQILRPAFAALLDRNDTGPQRSAVRGAVERRA